MGGNALQIGYFGEEGSFSHLAALRRFPECQAHSCATIEKAFDCLATGIASPIVVPIENASSGIIPDTVDRLIWLCAQENGQAFGVQECLSMRIKLVLLAKQEGIEPTVIYSHNAPLTHAHSWLAENYPHAKLVPTESTSLAAQLALGEPGTAALAGEQAAELYGLRILRDDVHQAVANRTKFYVIGRPLTDSGPATHTALLFELPDVTGSLGAALKVISDHGLNLTMIQSRPIPGRFDEYRFFIEFRGTPNEGKGRAALDELKAHTNNLSLLGTYPIVDLS